MRDALAHGEIVLTAIIGGERSVRALDYVMTRLSPEHFTEPRQRALIVLLHGYALQTHGIMTSAALEDLLRDKPAGSRLDLVTYYDALAGRKLPAGHEFAHSVSQLAVLAADTDTATALNTGLEILRHGVWTDNDKTHLKGHEDARAYVLAELARIERDLHLTDSPEGDAHDDADDVLAAYARAKEMQARGEAPGVLTGISALDRYMDGGIGPGEMAVIRAGTTIGKSRFCIQWAWDVSVLQGKNVVYFTTETLRPQICVNLIARHSVLSQFGITGADGLPGLNARKIRAGVLSRSEETALAAVIKDFKGGDYGRLRVVQMPEHCTISGMAARYAAIAKLFEVHFCVADYLQLFEAERRGREDKDYVSQASILKHAERWCGTVNGGDGVAFATPWQVNRTGRQNLRSSGGYTLEDSSGTQEASNTPDAVLDLLDREEDTSRGRRVPLEVAVMKMRDGPRGGRFPVEADYATCHFTDREVPAEDLDIDLEGAGD